MAELCDVDYSDFISSWQNYAHCITRARGDLKAVAVWLHKEIIAYCIFDPGTGDIANLAVAFLSSFQLHPSGKQFEMTRKL